MKKVRQRNAFGAIGFLTAFVLWTVAVCTVDVEMIGPHESAVGFAAFNGFVHRLTGVHMSLYVITDWLGLVPIAVAAGFATLGLLQWIKRKRLGSVDYDLFVLGGFYITVILAYLLFETVVINYRPVLINGFLEVSYPSSTTLLVMCVMPTAIMQLNNRIRHKAFKTIVVWVFAVFTVFMVMGRLISGVHWVSDIIGGGLLSTGLVLAYRALTG